MKMYVKPSIEVIELQLKENIAAVPTTVYRGSVKGGTFTKVEGNQNKLNLTKDATGLKDATIGEIGISIA